MPWKRKTTGGVLALIGYMLSPLSWWNDLFVNVPLAYAFASLLSLFYKPAFASSFVLGYWITNVLGLMLMHKGGEKILSDTDRKYRLGHLLRDVGISLAYTALIVALVKLGVLKPAESYFRKP
jgi:hypothetical protein